MNKFVGFLVVVGAAAWYLTKHPQLWTTLLSWGACLLPVIAIGLGLLLFAFIVWYGLVQIRIWLRI